MKYVEFLEFLGRISHEFFKESIDEELPLHLKIDKILGPLFKGFNLPKLFTYLQHPSGVHPLEKNNQVSAEYSSSN